MPLVVAEKTDFPGHLFQLCNFSTIPIEYFVEGVVGGWTSAGPFSAENASSLLVRE